MNYSELLSAYIEKSGLSIGEIAKRMSDGKGVKIDRSYISMLKNNKTKNPASEEVNRALAEVTGGDPDKLVIAAYLDKAPDAIRDFLEGIEDKNAALVTLIKRLVMDQDINKMKKQLVEENVAKYPELTVSSIENIIGGILSDPHTLFKFVKIPDFLGKLENSIKSGDIDQKILDILREFERPKDIIAEELTPYRVDSMLRLPVLGSIRAGLPIDRIEYNEGYTLVDPDLLRGKEGFALRVKGDSMSGDRILDGDIVIVSSQPEVLPHDIAVVAIDGDEATLKRVKVQGDMVMLSPSNPAYEPQLLPAKDVHIIGKVVEVKFWPGQNK